MGYFDYLKALLEPLGLYDLVNAVGAAELEFEGERLDELFAALETLAAEAVPLTAADFGLSRLEELFPYRPTSVNLEDRRRAISALLRIRNGYFTVQALCDTLSGCGISAYVRESEEPMTVEVVFPEVRGMPEDFERLQTRIEQILPCHLGIVYRFLYARWSDVMAGILSWQALEELCESWNELEAYEPGGAL